MAQQMRAKMKRAPGSKLPEPGSFIYAYCHVRTNQVLYSLDRTLKPRHLKQLPDVGANFTPPKLRKDQWRPFFTVSLPEDQQVARDQVQYIMRELREYRKLHETNWKPSPLLSRPYTQEEIDKMKKELDRRGGSKKETVYDIIKRKKWRLRVKTVMDQKANSVADLAAILLKQDEVGQSNRNLNQSDRILHKRVTRSEMREMAELAKNCGIEEAGLKVKELQGQKEKASRKQKPELYREIAREELKIKMMEFAIDAIPRAQEAARQRIALKEAARARAAAKNKGIDTNAGAKTGEEDTAATTEEQGLTDLEKDQILDRCLPRWPRDIDPWMIVADRKKSDWVSRGVVIRRRPGVGLNLANKPLRFDRPIFRTSGITIRWANPLDAEYAEAWPEDVEQQSMGLARHTAPLPPESSRHPLRLRGESEGDDYSPVAEDVVTLREMQLSKRNKEAKERRQRNKVIENIKTDILKFVAENEGAAKDEVSSGVSEGKAIRGAESPNRLETTT